ncbi:hypothetical protein [Alcanivorax sp.]|mgnify:CR=1 FL=1|uniref:hypothetical protein n=1 Tax=Alcanivorax sp. TaxID=1872427 RepID=UPI0032D8D88D
MIPATLSSYRRGHSLPLVLPLVVGLFLVQLILAWHAPTHIDVGQHSPTKDLLASADCQVCTHGHGMLALPSAYNVPDTTRTEPVPLAPATTVANRYERNPYPPRGPPCLYLISAIAP